MKSDEWFWSVESDSDLTALLIPFSMHPSVSCASDEWSTIFVILVSSG